MTSLKAEWYLQGSRITFPSLPAEIRNKIYRLVLVKESPVNICSPRQSQVVNQESTTANFGSLLSVNKQIQKEASPIFYAVNKFIVGNGFYGSSQEVNIHGFMAFVDCVPAHFIARITQVTMIAFLRGRTNVTSWSPGTYCLQSSKDAVRLQTIGETLARYFTGLECVTLDVCMETASDSSPEKERLSREGSIEGLTEVIKLLLTHPTAKEIHIRDASNVEMRESVERALNECPASGKIVKMFTSV